MAKKPSVGSGRRSSARSKTTKSTTPKSEKSENPKPVPAPTPKPAQASKETKEAKAAKPSSAKKKPARRAPAPKATRPANPADPQVTARPVEIDPEAYKFILAPPNMSPADFREPEFEYLGELPESYGTRKLFLVARDPDFLFSYWDFTEGQFLELSQRASDGNVFLQLYLENGEKLQQIQLHSRVHNWYIQANRPGASFYAELGIYREGKFEPAARSAVISAPPDTVSWRTQARFVTIPFHIPFRALLDIIRKQMQPGEDLAEALSRLQGEGFAFPFEVERARLGEQGGQGGVYDYLGEEVHRRLRVGSYDITEVLRRRLEQERGASSGQWPPSSASSPFGGKPRGFFMHVNAELILYGGTDPKAKVRIAGQDIELREDGTFTFHFNLPDGQYHIPVEAKAPDGMETRSALLSFLRMSDYSGEVVPSPQTPRPEPLGRTSDRPQA